MEEKKTFEDVVSLARRLRAPGGCPWDREQTLESLRAYVLEEAYEVIQAIELGDTLTCSGKKRPRTRPMP